MALVSHEYSTSLSGMVMNVRVRDYRMAAISLNNSAVSLLTRGFYLDAWSTFKDSLTLMRNATNMAAAGNVEENVHSQDQDASQEDIRLALDRATKRLVNIQYIAKDPATCYCEDNKNLLEVISTQSSLCEVCNALSATAVGCNVQIQYPTTIDPIEITSCSQDDLRLEAAVVLHNYGIASMIVSADENLFIDADAQNQVLVQAHHLFCMTRSVIATIDNEKMTYDPSDELQCRVLLQRAMLTYHLIQSATDLNLDSEMNIYRHDMQNLMRIVEVQARLLPMPDHPVARAA